MLDQLRQGAQGMTSKVLVGLLVLSFAVWGIGGFEGYGTSTVATVGDTDVTVEDFVRLYDQEQRIAAQSGRSADPQQLLEQAIRAAALDDEAQRYGLGISNDHVANEIASQQIFHDANGTFDRDIFEALLRNARMTQDDYILDIGRNLVRAQISDAVGAGVEAPQPMVEALYRYRNEERTISYVVVDETAVEPAGDPGEAELQAYFEQNVTRFRVPEYRELALLILDPAEIADPSAVSEEDVQAEYDRRRATFEEPERRRVEQIAFDTAAAAEAALAEIEAGTDFAAVAQSNGAEITDLGMKTRAEYLDAAIADAAFAAEIDTPLAVTDALQPSLIRVSGIEPGSVRPLAEVEERLREDLATRASRDAVNDLYDQIEDERAGGSTLEETARALSLPFRVIDGVARDRSTPDGSTVSDIPNASRIVSEAFETDIGIENSPIRAGDVWVFFEVTDIEEARDPALDEVRADAVAAWREARKEEQIAERAAALLERLRNGAALATIALELAKTVANVEGVKRGDAPSGLTVNAVNQAFAGPQGHVADADGAGNTRILLKVDRVVAPAFFAETTDAQEISGQLTTALGGDVLSAFSLQLRNDRPINVNASVFQQLTGQLTGELTGHSQ